MDEDIDVEEHDILDNPHVRNLFPDISILKEEVSNNLADDSESIKIKEECIEYDMHINPSLIVYEDNSTSSSDSEDYGSFVLRDTQVPLPNSRFALDLFYEGFFETQVNSTQPSVLLNNASSYLQGSQRFCRDCLILFPTKADFDNHNQTSHVCNVNLISKKKKKRFVQNYDNIDSRNIYYRCSICSCYFLFHGKLRRHLIRQHACKKLEEHVSSGNKPYIPDCRYCTQKLRSPYYYNQHIKGAHPKSFTSIRALWSNGLTNKDQSKQYYRCHVCFCFYKTIIRLGDHMRKKHKKQVILTQDLTKTWFDGKCRLCTTSVQFPTPYLYQSHVRRVHTPQYDEVEGNMKKLSTELCDNVTHDNNINESNFTRDMLSPEFNDAVDTYKNRKRDQISPKLSNVIEINSNDDLMSPELRDMKEVNGHHDKMFPTEKESSCINNLSKERGTASETETLDKYFPAMIFKCDKCDIHFLSAELAVNHLEHIEMLIHWKCLTCHRIFKKEDELLHTKQHLDNLTLDIKVVQPTTIARVLYKCPKCAVHLKKDNFIMHYNKCVSCKDYLIETTCVSCKDCVQV